MKNFGVRKIIEEYGVVTLQGNHLTDGDTPDHLKKLFRRNCQFPSNKSVSSPAIIDFGNTFFLGDDNHQYDDSNRYVHNEENIFLRGKFLVNRFSPRFLFLFFNISKKELLNIPVLQGRRSSSTKRSVTNAQDLLRGFFASTFADDEKENLINLFHRLTERHYGVLFLGFTSPNELPTVISGSIYEVVGNHGSAVHYLATDQNLVYDNRFKTGKDGQNFCGRGIGQSVICAITKVNRILGKNESLFLKCNKH